MYETVKTVNGYEITRMKGMHGAYHVNIREGKGFREYHTFRTIKAAEEFIKKVYPNTYAEPRRHILGNTLFDELINLM